MEQSTKFRRACRHFVNLIDSYKQDGWTFETKRIYCEKELKAYFYRRERKPPYKYERFTLTVDIDTGKEHTARFTMRTVPLAGYL